jgi:hypothetical protein
MQLVFDSVARFIHPPGLQSISERDDEDIPAYRQAGSSASPAAKAGQKTHVMCSHFV